MVETDKVNCFLCGKEGKVNDMCGAASPVVGSICDLALAMSYLCPDPCFKTFKHSPHVRGRVYRHHDAICLWSSACVARASEEQLDEMSNLPEGLKITPEEKIRVKELQNNLSLENLNKLEDLLLVLKVVRNINKSKFRHPKTNKIKDYEDLVRDFKNLEKLTPEERELLND